MSESPREAQREARSSYTVREVVLVRARMARLGPSGSRRPVRTRTR
jgi:hypothetical protein